MKRLLATLTLIICLSFPAFAGHVQLTGAYCDCGTEDCICDSGEGPMFAQSQNAPSDYGSESLLILAAVMLWLRLKA